MTQNSLTLSKRLLAVASFVEQDANIADIGSDHAKLPLFLIKQNRIRRAFCVENKKGPFERMENEIKKNGADNKCLASLSDGISNLPPWVDTVILAGIGGPLIASIVSKQSNKLVAVKTLIVDAHTNQPFVIQTLSSLDFHLADSTFLYDEGKPYNVMKWQRGKLVKPYDEDEIFFGPINLKKRPKEWILFWRNEQKRLESILKNNDLPDEKKKEYIILLKRIDKVVS